MIQSIRDFLRRQYTTLYENQEKLRKLFIWVSVLYAIYQLIDAFTNYTLGHFVMKELEYALYAFIVYLIIKIYHALFGKWYVHETNVELTRVFVEAKLPRSIKMDGYRGAGKDTTSAGMVKSFRNDLVNRILDEMDLIQVLLYPFDFQHLETFLHEHHQEYLTNSKNSFYMRFIQMMKEHQGFLKPYYQKEYLIDDLITELQLMKKDPLSEEIQAIKLKYDDGISKKHFLSILIRYCLLFIRIHYLNNFVITNQPYLETYETPAKIFSTKFITIQKEDAEWIWPIAGGIIIVETEADAFYPNVGGGESAMKTGMRNFKAFFRHLLGEESVWIHIGQKAKRTEKSVRELDQAFITVIEKTQVDGGEKRRFFLNQRLKWHELWIRHSLRKRAKEKHVRKRSQVIQKFKQLINEGYLYIDLKVSRSDEGGAASQQSIKQLLRYDKKIFENYMVKLCFPIKDCYGWFNSHYLEAIAETLANKSKLQFQDVPLWNPDLTLTKKQAAFMAYPVLNDMLKIETKKPKRQPKNTTQKESDDLEGREETTKETE